MSPVMNQIYIRNGERKDYLNIGVEINGKNFGLACKRNLREVAGGIESALNSLKAIRVYGDKALTKDGDINVDFMLAQKDYDQEKVEVDYEIVLT